MTGKNWVFIFIVLAALTAIALYASDKVPKVSIDAASLPSHEVLLSRGEYLLDISGCGYCHTDSTNGGQTLAGGREMRTPYGIFFTPNITPDKDSGIGKWKLEDFIRAMRHGVSPHGTHYFPAFPYTSYSGMTTEDMASIFTHLRSVAPVKKYNRQHRTAWFVWRGGMRFWKKIYFKAGALTADPMRTGSLNRGHYLAAAVGHCEECHTRRNGIGVISPAVRYSGNVEGVLGEPTPNITSSRRSGIGKWTEKEIHSFLKTGSRPDGVQTQGWMADIVRSSMSKLTNEDAQALTRYLKSIPEVD